MHTLKINADIIIARVQRDLNNFLNLTFSFPQRKLQVPTKFMPFPGSVSNKANQSKTKKCYLSVISVAMNFYSSCSANRSDVFSSCDKRIWIEKSAFFSTKPPLISACRFSFTFDEITAVISNSEALCSEHCSELFSNSFQTGNQLSADHARSANQDEVIMPS